MAVPHVGDRSVAGRTSEILRGVSFEPFHLESCEIDDLETDIITETSVLEQKCKQRKFLWHLQYTIKQKM